MKKIYLIRHGQTTWNQEKRMQGQQDSPLSINGIEQANSAQAYLQDVTFDYIVSSPLCRAFNTAEIIKGNRNINIETNSLLKEIALGKWEGMHDSQVAELYPHEHYNFWNAPHLFKPIGEGETIFDIYKRAEAFLKQINSSDFKTALVVSHTILIKCILLLINGLPLKELWNTQKILPASITLLNYDSNNFIAEYIGNTNHYVKNYQSSNTKY